jgi:2-oxoglutarate ferredoxin oxidoreductase subunit gamma
MTQNFGPEARGGACSAQLVVSDSPILYPYVTVPDILVDHVARGLCALRVPS